MKNKDNALSFYVTGFLGLVACWAGTSSSPLFGISFDVIFLYVNKILIGACSLGSPTTTLVFRYLFCMHLENG